MQQEHNTDVILEELEHQTEAIDAIMAAMPPLSDNFNNFENTTANPIIQNAGDESRFIDVEMATGTGKTYTYTKMMFELNARYRISKFVVVTPTSAIKVGTENTLKGASYKQHFSKNYDGVSLNVATINKGDFTSKGNRRSMPFYIKEFCENDARASKTIDVILLNYKGFLDGNDSDDVENGKSARSMSSLFRTDYDTGLFGGLSNPAEMIASTKPFVIVDEPHKFKRDGKAYEKMMKHFKPQMVVRFGATFPEIIEGSGRNKVTKTDYYQGSPAFTLTTFDAMEEGLIKGVEGSYASNNATNEFYVVSDVKAKRLTLEKDGRTFEISKFAKLSEETGDVRFDEIEYDGKDSDSGEFCLSNDMSLKVGTKIYPEILTHEYQRELIKMALDVHFETEKENFVNDGFKIKTNALFFIDSIASYRKRGNNNTWLKDAFEEILQRKLQDLIDCEGNAEYREFLQASLDNIDGCHGGYFSEDNSSSDDKIAGEVDFILKDKANSLKFKDENGKWNLRRFFFSKWTLREGWDNPNVFTICKLRSSGSEISKIQEVGRGLRLPVNEKGKRLANRDWVLSYIVDESESDFIEKLAGEVNATAGKFVVNGKKIDDEAIEKLINKEYESSSFKVKGKLIDEGIIDENEVIVDAKALNKLLGAKQTSKVRNKDGKSKTVKLRKNNWMQLKSLWKKFSERYMIKFDDVPELQCLFEGCLTDDVFDDNKTTTVFTQSLHATKNEMEVLESTREAKTNDSIALLPYVTFLKKLADETSLPRQLIHSALVQKLGDTAGNEAIFNKRTLNKIIAAWKEKFAETYSQKFEYKKLGYTANTSVLVEDEFVEEIASGAVGAHKVITDVDSRYLYDEVLVDSIDPEADIAKFNPSDEIKVYGKLPRRSIQIPTYTGGTTSPDFIYSKDGDLYLLIEAKPPKSAQRKSDERVVKNQEKFIKEELDANVAYGEVTNVDEAKSKIRYFVEHLTSDHV